MITMKKTHEINTDALVDLINQLAGISRWLAGEYTSIDGAYRRYQSFYVPVTDALRDFGIRMEYNGYAYILEAVKLIIERDNYDVRLKTDVYPPIARKYHLAQSECIEHNIRNAINAAYRDNLKRPGSNMMGKFHRKPTSKQFIMYIADQVRRSMYAEAETLPEVC
jgi:hypothetical protein